MYEKKRPLIQSQYQKTEAKNIASGRGYSVLPCKLQALNHVKVEVKKGKSSHHRTQWTGKTVPSQCDQWVATVLRVVRFFFGEKRITHSSSTELLNSACAARSRI